MRLFTLSLFLSINIMAAPQLICRLSLLCCTVLPVYRTDQPTDRGVTPHLPTPEMLKE